MYSVLIQNEKTIELFNEFYPLFLDLMDTRIGICRWNEAGTTVDTALPEINNLTDDKRDWRAVIVRVADESSMRRHRCDCNNPYDFTDEDDKNSDSIVKETNVPLVRLTQMLGGVPAPDAGYSECEKYVRRSKWTVRKEKGVQAEENSIEAEEDETQAKINAYLDKIKNENEIDREEFEKSPLFLDMGNDALNDWELKYFFKENALSKADQDEYDRLCKQFEFVGKPPTEIFLITFNNKYKENQRDVVKGLWTNPLESASSEFWKRNNYPGKCRFMTYNCVNEGPVKRDADLFNFWVCVMLLASNDPDPSSLQAYRLYDVRAQFDKDVMYKSVRAKAEEMLKAKVYFAEEIKRDIEEKALMRKEPPQVSKNVEIPYKAPNYVDVNVDTDEFGLTMKSLDNERRKWAQKSDAAEHELNRVYKKAERQLETSTDTIRLHSTYDEDDVILLDRFAEEDLRNASDRRRHSIIEAQEKLPYIKREVRHELDALALEIQKSVHTRLTSATTWMVVLVVAVAVLFAAIPAFLFYFMFDRGALWGVLIFLGVMLVVYGLTELFVLRYQRKQFISRIDAYNEILSELADKLTTSVAMFREFASSILTYAREQSYIDFMEKKQYLMDNSYDTLHKHYRATDRMIEILKRWSDAYYLDIDFNEKFDSNIYVDTSIAAERNTFFALETDNEYQVPINENGEYIISPLGFVKKLEIIREELYEK